MDPGSKQDGGVVNMTRAIEALSPWLNNPRRTIVRVEALVVTAAALLLLQLIFGHCKRRWHNFFIRGVLLVCNAVMFPLILYTLSIMQSFPIKNSSYPVWAVFLVIASDGTVAFQQYDFYGSALKKYAQAAFEIGRYSFYLMMLLVLMSPLTSKEAWTNTDMHAVKFSSASSIWVRGLIAIVFGIKLLEGMLLLRWESMDLMRCRAVAEQMRKEKWADDHPSDSDPESMQGYNYPVQLPSVTIDQIWERCDNSNDGKALKDICLSFALFQLLKRRYLGLACAEARHSKTRHFVFKKLLTSEGEYERVFRIVELELSFCYDYFFTRYGFVYTLTNFGAAKIIPVRIQVVIFQLFLLALSVFKIFCISAVGMFAVRKSLVLETRDPIIEVHITRADYSVTLLVVGIALIVQLLQVAFYLASDWVQVSLACMHVNFHVPIAFVGKVIALLRMATISGAWTRKINQRSILFWKSCPVDVSDKVKRAIARSLLKSIDAALITDGILTNGKTSLMKNQNLSWTLENHSQLEIMLIWHIATEYCALSKDLSNGIAPDDRGVAVILSRYSMYLMASAPELLPYHEVDIKESLRELVEDGEIGGSSFLHFLKQKIGGHTWSHGKMKNLQGTNKEDDPTTVFKKGVKLGKQLERMQDGDQESMPDGDPESMSDGDRERDPWKVMKEFWSETLIYVAPSHSTAKQHMKHLEEGGEFLTLIWALLSHAGILNLDRDKDQGPPEGAEIQVGCP